MKRFVSVLLTLAMLATVCVSGISINSAPAYAAEAGPPSVSVAKAEFEYGEDIVVTYNNISKSLLTGTFVSIAIFKKGDVVGTHGSKAEHRVWHKDATVVASNTENATVAYPEADNGRNGVNFPLAIGEYYVCIRQDSKVVGEIAEFKVVAPVPKVSLEKTEFEYGEDIVVTYNNISKSLLTGNFVSIAIFKKGDVVGTHGSKAEHRVWHKDASIVTSKTENATVAYPDADNGRNGVNFPLAIGEYYVCIRQDSQVVGEIAEFKVVARTPKVSLEKTEFEYGEDITVTYKNVEESLLSGKSYVTIAIFKKGDVIGAQASKAEHRVWHKDTSIATSKLANATISFPDADNARNGVNFPLAVGDYYVCIRQDNGMVGESVAFSVVPGAPKISLSKTEYVSGEDITVTYMNITESLRTNDYVSIAIFKKGDVVGTHSSKAEHRVWHKDASVVASKTANATVSYPNADNGRNGVNFPLPAGEYYLCIRNGNNVIGDTVAFKVTKGAITAAQPEIKESITMHYTAALSKTLSDVQMKFIFDGQETIVAGTVIDSSDGYNTYTFALPGILPQQMGDNIQSALYAGNTLIDVYDNYSVKQYCLNLLAETTDAELRALLVSMLNYGTEAQKYFEQAVDSFVNEGVDQSYLNGYDMSQVQGVIANPVSGNNTGDYVWKAATLGLYDEIKIRVKFYAASVENLSIVANGVSYTDFISAGTDLYYVYIPVHASDFEEALTITFDCDGAVGATLTYSVTTYIQYAAHAGTPEIQSLLQAIYDYGMAAKDYAMN